jgi:hypothetical protein
MATSQQQQQDQQELSGQLPPKDTSDAEAFNRWYVTAIRFGQPTTSGRSAAMVIRPYGFSLWGVQASLDRRFKASGHKNAYFRCSSEASRRGPSTSNRTRSPG